MSRSKYIFLLLFVSSCFINFACKKYFAAKGKELTEPPLARVHEKYLYPSDVAGMGAGSTQSDSMKMINQYITDWVKRNLIIDKAEKNLPKELLDIDQKVENYRQSLIIYNYESELIAQKLNTNIPKEEKLKYYNQYPNSFVLDDDIFNIEYIVLAMNTPQLDNWLKLFKSTTQEDQVQLRSLCKISSPKFEIDHAKWLTRAEIMKLLDVPADFFEKLNKGNEIIKYYSGSSLILVKKLGNKATGELAPYDRVEADINQILVTKSKTTILDQIYKEIYEEGETKKEFEVLNNIKK